MGRDMNMIALEIDFMGANWFAAAKITPFASLTT